MLMPTIDELLIADDSKRWAALGFAVADGRCQIDRVRLRFLTGGAERGILGWSLRDVVHTELDGLATTISEQPAPDPAPAHPNGAVAIDHIVAISPSLDRSVGALQHAGLDLRRIREQPTPAGAPRQAFFRLGNEILELIQEPYDLVERTGRQNRPARFWGLAIRVDNLDRTVDLLGPHAGPIRPALQPDRRIATVRRSASLAVALVLMSAPAKG